MTYSVFGGTLNFAQLIQLVAEVHPLSPPVDSI